MSRTLSLRTRLLGLQLVVFGGLVLLAGPVTSTLLSRSLQRDRDRHLEGMAAGLAREYLAAGRSTGFEQPCLVGAVPPGSPDPQATHRPRHFLVVDPSGRVLCGDGESEPLRPDAVAEALATGNPAFSDVRWSAERLRLVAWPFDSREGRPLVMEVGASQSVIQSALRRGVVVMAVVDLAALGFLFTGSLLLTRRAFEPIERIVLRVEGIDEANLAARLPVEPGVDEANRLAGVLNRLLERLERAFEAQRRFSSDVAHEIRSPLTALRGQIEVALRRPRPQEEYRRVLEECLEEVLRLSRLAEDLMSLARADAGVLEARRERLDLRDLVRHLLGRFRVRVEEKDLRVSLDAPAEVRVTGDPDLLSRLLENLVDNAIIHSPRMEEVRVAIRSEDRWARVTISDRGPGIPPEHLGRIFDRFYRVDPARSREQGGSGLGLAIAKEIAQLHGGRLEVESTVGEGCSFRVSLPLVVPSCTLPCPVPLPSRRRQTQDHLPTFAVPTIPDGHGRLPSPALRAPRLRDPARRLRSIRTPAFGPARHRRGGNRAGRAGNLPLGLPFPRHHRPARRVRPDEAEAVVVPLLLQHAISSPVARSSRSAPARVSSASAPLSSALPGSW